MRELQEQNHQPQTSHQELRVSRRGTLQGPLRLLHNEGFLILLLQQRANLTLPPQMLRVIQLHLQWLLQWLLPHHLQMGQILPPLKPILQILLRMMELNQ